MEKLWTTAEVARYLGIAEVDVEQLVREGKLTGYKLGGQFLRFRPNQVEELKGAIRFRQPGKTRKASARAVTPWGLFKEFFYYYDFYVVSALLLAVLIVYLVAAS